MEALLEGQRIDRLEHRRIRHRAEGALHILEPVDERRLRRVDAGVPGAFELRPLVVQVLHHRPAREGQQKEALEPLGMTRERPDVLVVGREQHRLLRQARAKLLQKDEECLFVRLG